MSPHGPVRAAADPVKEELTTLRSGFLVMAMAVAPVRLPFECDHRNLQVSSVQRCLFD